MAYGIDSTIQDKVNAFRGQPQQLMQQYGQSQQLVDLLALQQIKSEKEAAARQIQMAMAQKQGQPTTIAQQREQEVMGLTRNEIAKQVQQGMPQQSQAPQQAPQQGGGISALPAPNMQGMQNMAGGGIVAFAGTEGSYIEGKRNPIDELIGYQNLLQDKSLDSEQAEMIRKQVEKIQEQLGGPDAANYIAAMARPEAAKVVTKAGGRPFSEAFMDFATQETNGRPQNTPPPLNAAFTQGAPESTANKESAEKMGLIPSSGPQGIAKLAADKAAPVTQAAPVAQQTMADAASAGIIPTTAAPTTSSGGIEDIIKRVNSGYNMDEINKQRADIAAQIAKLNAEQNDPSTQNRDRLAAFLSAAGAGTSLASGARLGGAAVNELNATRQAARAAQLKDLQTTADSRAKELMEMGFKRSDAIERAIAEANQTAAMTRGQDIQAASAANQTAAYNLNSQRDFDASMARFAAEDRKTAEAERVADKRLDAALLANQNIDSAGRIKIMEDFASNYAPQAEANVIKEITDAKGKNAAETAKKDGTVQRQVDSIGKEFLLSRIRAIQGSYGGAAPTPGVNPNDPMAKFYR